MDNFKSVLISDATGISYFTEVNIKESLTHNVQSTIVVPINGDKPYFVKTGKARYWSGTITADFADNQTNPCPEEDYGDYDLTNSSFRFAFIEWMHNGYKKTLKISNDLILRVGIGNQIQVETDSTVDDENVKVTFEWTEVKW
jgi:hypothetical protein